MDSGHTLFAIAGIFLISTLVLNVYKANIERMLDAYSSESVIEASGIAQSIIEEMLTKAFDEITINSEVWSSDSLTGILDLGPDLGES